MHDQMQTRNGNFTIHSIIHFNTQVLYVNNYNTSDCSIKLAGWIDIQLHLLQTLSMDTVTSSKHVYIHEFKNRNKKHAQRTT